MPLSLTEAFYTNVKTRLEAILTDPTYSLYGTLHSVQLKAHRQAGGEQPEVNLFASPTIIVSDLGDDSTSEEVDTWVRNVTGQCWYATTDGDLLNLIRAYEDMLRALNPAELPGFTLATYSRSYQDPFTQEQIEGVILTFSGTYRASFDDPSTV